MCLHESTFRILVVLIEHTILAIRWGRQTSLLKSSRPFSDSFQLLSAAVGHNEDAPGSLGDVAVFFASYILNWYGFANNVESIIHPPDDTDDNDEVDVFNDEYNEIAEIIDSYDEEKEGKFESGDCLHSHYIPLLCILSIKNMS